MKLKLILVGCFVLLLTSSRAQLMQGSIRTGASANQVEVWIKPNFSNSTDYIAQMLLPLAFPAGVTPLPTLTAANITLAPEFISTFGSNYTINVYPISNSTDNTEKYFSIAVVRGGAGASNPQTWTAGTAYRVLTASFQGSPASTQIKLADYQDAGVDGQGNFYAANGTPTYYYDFATSSNNFYSIAGESTAGGTASAGFARTNALISLPVNLLNFSGYKSGLKNILSWTTANEQNSRGFDVQRSDDGSNYSSLGFVDSKAPGGTSSTTLNYTFEDNNPAGKKQYYRLRQSDLDGHNKLSTIVIINRDKPTQLGIGGLFPNPASTVVNVMIDAPQRDNVTLLITDMGGKTVRQQQASVNVGSNTVPVDIAKLAGGTYLVKLNCQSSDCETASAKFNKQ